MRQSPLRYLSHHMANYRLIVEPIILSRSSSQLYLGLVLWDIIASRRVAEARSTEMYKDLCIKKSHCSSIFISIYMDSNLLQNGKGVPFIQFVSLLGLFPDMEAMSRDMEIYQHQHKACQHDPHHPDRTQGKKKLFIHPKTDS